MLLIGLLTTAGGYAAAGDGWERPRKRERAGGCARRGRLRLANLRWPPIPQASYYTQLAVHSRIAHDREASLLEGAQRASVVPMWVRQARRDRGVDEHHVFQQETDDAWAQAMAQSLWISDGQVDPSFGRTGTDAWVRPKISSLSFEVDFAQSPLFP